MPVATTTRGTNGTRHSRRGNVPASPQAGPSKPRFIHGDADADDEDEDGEANGGDMEEEEGWTADTFVNQPVDKNSTAIVNLRSLSDKLKDVISRIDEGLEQAKETAFAIEDAHPDDEAIAEVEAAIFRALDQRQLLLIKIDVLESLGNQLRAGKTFTNIDREFKQESEKREADYLGKSQRAKYKKVKEYVDFRTHLWEINHNSACPPTSQWLDRGAEEESSDEDFDIGGQTQTYKCPITLTLYEDVVTSTECNHSYSRIAIENLINTAKRARRAPKCPISGCSTVLDKTDLKPNPTLQKRADEFKRRQQRREEEQEDGDDTINIGEEDDI